jgi:hypothetical protein
LLCFAFAAWLGKPRAFKSAEKSSEIQGTINAT